MPPEQFGGRAVPASDLYSLGATLIALITKQHPADLPQKDLQLEFEQFTQLSPAFTNWLKWMTDPSLERRPASVQIAKEVLQKPQQINKYSLRVRQGIRVSASSFAKKALSDSTWTGVRSVGVCAGIYSTFILPILGTIIGGIVGLFIGFLVGWINGIIVQFVTDRWFDPLTNPKLHRQVLTAISIVICTLTSIIFFLPLANTIVSLQHNDDGSISIMNSSDYIIFVLVPSLIAGLSMGATSKSIARWYQKESGL